jgi:hypothetical protein
MEKGQIIFFSEFEKIEWAVNKKSVQLFCKIWKNSINKSIGFVQINQTESNYFHIGLNKLIFIAQSECVTKINKNIFQIGADIELTLTNEILRVAPFEIRKNYFLSKKERKLK